MAKTSLSAEVILQIVEEAASFHNDPLGFVLWCFPWGEPNTALEKWPEGPDKWQRDYLADLGQQLRNKQTGVPIRMAVGAANGVGKSALVAMLIIWAHCTSDCTKGTVTANTQLQLRTKTWAELAKWHGMAITNCMMTYHATSLESSLPSLAPRWRIDAVPWSKERPEAIAGLHNLGKRILLAFDEASAVDDVIWEYTDATTSDADTEIIWAVFGNTTRNSGRFKECWGKFSLRWKAMKVDGRECRSTNKALIKQWETDYGVDSDFYRVRVLAQFPRVGDMQFFPSNWIDAAKARRNTNDFIWQVPATISVDVATSGSNKTVVVCRRGDAIMWIKAEAYTPDTMILVGKLVDMVKQERNVRCVCVDANGVGKGVADRLSELQGQMGLPTIIHVYGSAAAGDPIQFRNMRSELFGKFREWLRHGVFPTEPGCPALFEQMEQIEGGYNNVMQMEVETKKEMVTRLGTSPDELDAVIYSFAEHVYVPQALNRGAVARRNAPVIHQVRWK